MRLLSLVPFYLLFFITLSFCDNTPVTESSRLWIGTVAGELRALNQAIYNAPSTGEILFLKKPGTELKSQEVWAIFNREALLNRKKNLDLARTGLKFQLAELNEKKKVDQKKLEEQLIEIDDELLKLEELKTASFADDYEVKIDLAAKNLLSKKADLQSAFDRLYEPEKVNYEREQLLFKFETQESDYEAFERGSYLKSEFTGTLTYLLPQEKFDLNDKNVAQVIPSDSLAMISNDSMVFVDTPATNFERPLNRKGIYIARVVTDAGMRFRAEYHNTFTVVKNTKPQKFYRFRVSQGDLATAQNSIGQAAVLNVMQEFDQEYTIIKKEDIIRDNPTLVQEKGWEFSALTMFPTMKLVAVGKGSIAMEPK